MYIVMKGPPVAWWFVTWCNGCIFIIQYILNNLLKRGSSPLTNGLTECKLYLFVTYSKPFESASAWGNI